MSLTADALRQRLTDRASLLYRGAGRFAYHFARGKLGSDPMFLAILQRGLLPDNVRILDLGCGQGLLAAWLFVARQTWEAGDWPTGWAAPGHVAALHGVDVSSNAIRRARAAMGRRARFEKGDIREIDLGQADAIVILDVLHYVDRAAQDDVLRRAHKALSPHGLLLIRVGDASAGWGFRLSNRVDRTAALFRDHALPHLYCRPLADWIRTLEATGFVVDSIPMDGGLPFANVMLVARVNRASPAADIW